MGRDRAIVDDAAAARDLRLHQPDRLLGAEKSAGQVDPHDPCHSSKDNSSIGTGRARAGIVEQKVQPAEAFAQAREQKLNGMGIGNIGRLDQAIAAFAGGLIQCFGAATGQDKRISFARQRLRHRAAHTAARSRYQCNPGHGGTMHPSRMPG